MPDTTKPIHIEPVNSLTAIRPSAWDALDDTGNPFLRHAFLAGLEQHDCLQSHGWTPVHLLAWQDQQLVGGMPLYSRDNSWGEFVFDWSWAEAHESSIGPYYPKLVSAIPFTPVTGPRVLAAPLPYADDIRNQLVCAARELARSESLSSLHVLFPDHESDIVLAYQGLLSRSGYQFHWHNRNYTDFDDFLAVLNSKRRKEIRRERRTVAGSGLHVEVLRGAEIREHHWAAFHAFYCDTFYRKWGRPRLTLDFFLHLSGQAPELPLLLLARDGSRYVAGTLALLGRDTLYGRHWGCNAGYRNLHFELCYYQTIEFCIRERLARLDAGVQGEHKLSRGFEPIRTCSYHWLADRRFHAAVAAFLDREQRLVDEYLEHMNRQLAYRHNVLPS